MQNARDFGAVGDGITNDTAALQHAIDAGGMVYIPAGTYVTGTLYLRSHGGLELDSHAVLRASLRPEDYCPPDFCQQMTGNRTCGQNGGHLIVALEQEGITIRGGLFDGVGRHFFCDHTVHHRFTGGPQWERPNWHPQQCLFICECKDVRLEDFAIEDTTGWACFIYGCQNVSVSRIRINNSPFIPEDDGLDIDCCSDVTVCDCVIYAGDDALTLRGCEKKLKQPRICERVSISNCTLNSYYAHAIRVGVGSGEIRDCHFDNVRVLGGHAAIHINSKYSDLSDGVEIHDISFRDMDIDADQMAFIRLDYKFVHETPTSKNISNILIENVSGQIRYPSMLYGNGVGDIHDITFKDINLHVTGKCDISENTRKFIMVDGTEAPFELTRVHDVHFSDVRLNYEHPEAWSKDIAQHDCHDIIVQSNIQRTFNT
ncbi:MAG: hypothetical protein J6X55_14795 [Victivallales bacterium]|nr:hypothetical protein [Victivallales bacterium]